MPLTGIAKINLIKSIIFKREYPLGQVFWRELTGDADFYLKLIRLMRDYPVKHRILFEKEVE